MVTVIAVGSTVTLAPWRWLQGAYSGWPNSVPGTLQYIQYVVLEAVGSALMMDAARVGVIAPVGSRARRSNVSGAVMDDDAARAVAADTTTVRKVYRAMLV
jgi:hypothetical protein